jgi:UDP-glucose 6-dehydrogenase
MRSIVKQTGVNTEKIFKITTQSAEGLWNPKYGTEDKGSFGGKCLPKDTQAFLAWAQSRGFDADILKTVIKVNGNNLRKTSQDNRTIREEDLSSPL